MTMIDVLWTLNKTSMFVVYNVRTKNDDIVNSLEIEKKSLPLRVSPYSRMSGRQPSHCNVTRRTLP